MAEPTLIDTSVAAALELAINQALRLDPGSQVALQSLTGKTLRVDITQPPLSLVLRLGYPLEIAGHSQTDADCTLRGSAMNFASLAYNGYHNLAKAGVTQEGDIALLGKLMTLAKQIEIDWELPLTHWLGDVAGHVLASNIRRQLQWLQHMSEKTPFFIGDYLTHELGLIPSAEEIADFCLQVDETRADSDRLQARLTHLAHVASPISTTGGA